MTVNDSTQLDHCFYRDRAGECSSTDFSECSESPPECTEFDKLTALSLIIVSMSTVLVTEVE